MTAPKTKFNKPVAFNTKNDEDNLILKHVKRRNFSGYVKKLILADIKSREETKPKIEDVEPVKIDDPKPEPKTETAAEKINRMRKQMKKPSNQAPGPLIIRKH